MKKIVSVLLSIILIISISSIAGNAQEVIPCFEVVGGSAEVGETVDVNIKVKNNPGITSLQVKVEYSNKDLELVGFDDKELFGNPVTHSELSNNPMIISWFDNNSTNKTNSGILVTLRFRIKENAEPSNITLTYDADNVFNINFDNVYFQVVNGTVDIKTDSPQLFVSSETGNVNDTVETKVYIKNNPSITALRISIAYSSDDLELLEINNGGIFEEAITHSQTLSSPVTISWYSQKSKDCNNNGILAVLKFRIKDNAQSSQIFLSYDEDDIFNSSFDNVYFDTQNGVVTVDEKILAGIAVSKQPTKTSYFVGENLDTTGLQLKLSYNDGSTSYATSGFTTSGYDSTKAGTKTITVTYQDKTATFNVTVKEKTLTGISVSKQPSKTIYFIGENLDTTGLQLKLSYDDGSTSDATSGFTTSGFDSTKAGTQTVTVTYLGKTATFNVTVKNKSLTDISVSKQPSKTIYFIGENLDTTGLQLKLIYDDGSTSYVSSGFTTNGFSSTSAGIKTVTVTYSGKTTTFTVRVKQNKTILMGDIDGDGEITTDDAMMVISYINGKIDLNIFQRLSADVMHDMQLNSVDALAITKYANNGQINGLIGQTIPLDKVFGDPNNDGKIDITDATYIQNYLAEYIEFSELQYIVADVNGDGNVNIQDVTDLQRYIAEIIAILPVLDSMNTSET